MRRPAIFRPRSRSGQLTDYTPKVRIEIVAPDDVAETIFQRITGYCPDRPLRRWSGLDHRDRAGRLYFQDHARSGVRSFEL